MVCYQRDVPIAARATAAGPGAIAVIRCSGSGSFLLLKPLFSQPRVLDASYSHHAKLGWLRDPASGECLDQVLLLPFARGRSFTGEESVELHCHGGEAVVERVVQLLLSHGFEPALPGEFSYRAFSHGRIDLTQAEAIAALSSAVQQQQRQQALQQLEGGMSRFLQQLQQKMLQLLALVEVQLDYAEEEVELPPLDWSILGHAQEKLRQMLDNFQLSERCRKGLQIVLMGEVNAGKSSLFNLLLQRERAIVSPQPGTTRDYLDAELIMDQRTLHLYDTAGLRSSLDWVEQQGIRWSERLWEQADLLLVVVDASSGLPPLLAPRLQALPEQRWLGLWNKCDLVSALPAPPRWIPFSCQDHRGLDQLYQQIRLRLPPEPPQEGVFPLNMRQERLVSQTLTSVEEAVHLLENGQSDDLLAEPLRQACDLLGELTGSKARAEMLEQIFTTFCLGK